MTFPRFWQKEVVELRMWAGHVTAGDKPAFISGMAVGESVAGRVGAEQGMRTV